MADQRKDDAYQITWLVRRLFRAMGQTANSYLETLGVTAAERAVMEFLVRESRMTVPEIARAYDVSRQHIQASVNTLLEKRLVAYEDNPGHKRSPFVVLSKRGYRLFDRITKKDQALIRSIFSGISKSEQKTTRQTLQSILDNLSEGVRT